MNNQINKCIIKTRDNDAAIINTAIELADDECNVMKKNNNPPDISSGEGIQNSNPQVQQQRHM